METNMAVKDNIYDFIDAWKAYDGKHNHDVDWNSRFKRAGYYSAEVSRQSITHSWNQMHQWCKEHIGEKKYAWTGSTFWFESRDDAAFFILKWA